MTKRIIPTGSKYFTEPYSRLSFEFTRDAVISLEDGDYRYNPFKLIVPEFVHPEAILLLLPVLPLCWDELKDKENEPLYNLRKHRCPDAYKFLAEKSYKWFPDTRARSEDIIEKSKLMAYYWMCADPEDRAELIAPLTLAGASFISHNTIDLVKPSMHDVNTTHTCLNTYDRETHVGLYDGYMFHVYDLY
jgi:hypothetical protein